MNSLSGPTRIMSKVEDYQKTPGYKKAVAERQAKLAAEEKSKVGKEELLTEFRQNIQIQVQDRAGVWRTARSGVSDNSQIILQAMQGASQNGRRRVRAIDHEGRVIDFLTGPFEDTNDVAIDTTVQEEGDRASDRRPAHLSRDREAGGAVKREGVERSPLA
jgi:hypothetical protein